MVDPRYTRNIPSLSEEEWIQISQKRVCVIGCGGLGGNIIEHLARIGVGAVTVVDGDTFDTSNLNRQLLSNPSNLGQSKAVCAAERIRLINPDVKVQVVEAFLDEDNASSILAGHDVVIDALDSPDARRILAKACAGLDLTMIHGAISGWCGQIAVLKPGSLLMDNLYGDRQSLSSAPSTLSFTPSVCASIEVSEAVKVMCGRETELYDHMLFFDLQNNSFHLFDVRGIS